MNNTNHLLLFLLICALFVISAAAPSFVHADTQAGAPKGKGVFDSKCLQCHKETKFKDLHYARREWEQIVSRMELNTCVLSDAEFSAVCDYLANEHGE